MHSNVFFVGFFSVFFTGGGFCGEACHVRNIVQHLVKAHTGKRGSGCGSVSVDALRQLICFIEPRMPCYLGKQTDGWLRVTWIIPW